MSVQQLLDQLSARDLLVALEIDTATVARIATTMLEQREISAFDWTDLKIVRGRMGVFRDLVK